jgi:tRNA A37 threonylcarbamoyladenosine synthetase subunit TsaC/SUA5/YrdC
VQQLRSIKQRSSSAPLAVAVADVADVGRYCCTDQLPDGLLAALLPGPVTVLLPRRQDAAVADGVLSPGVDAGSSSDSAPPPLGVRVVPNEFVRRVCRGLGGGIALTSANVSGDQSSVCVGDFRCGVCHEGGGGIAPHSRPTLPC